MFGLEYFVFEGDDMWTMGDDDLVALATKGIDRRRPGRARFRRRSGLRDAVPKAYPVYDDTYRENVEVIHHWFKEQSTTSIPSDATACTSTTTRTTPCTPPCSRSRTCTVPPHDIWSVNVEEEYHETADGHSGSAPAASTVGRDGAGFPRRAG